MSEKKVLQPHQQRVVDELKDLKDKIEKLEHFINENPIYGNLPIDEQSDLIEQSYVMNEYSEILERRIDRF